MPTMFGMHLLSFPISTLKNIFVKFWRLFLARTLPEQAKLKTESGLLGFTSKTYPHYLVCGSYCFLSIYLINVSVQLWRHFRVRTPQEQALSIQSWKPGSDDSVLHTRLTDNVLGCVSYRFLLVRLKIVLVEFRRLFWEQIPPEQTNLKNRVWMNRFWTRSISTLFGV